MSGSFSRGGRGGRNFYKGRGGRRGNPNHQTSHDTCDNDSSEYQAGSEGRADRPPKGLRGRAIGMWYANRNRERSGYTKEERDQKREERNKRKEVKRRTSVTLNHSQQSLINKALSKMSIDKDKRTLAGEFSVETGIEEDGWFSKRPLKRDSSLDIHLKQDFDLKTKCASYIKMLDFRRRLPAYEKKDKIMEMILSDFQACVISGATGSGKTTQVPQFILDDCLSKGKGSLCKVICTQPRRISAISVAERVAAERGESFPSGNRNKIQTDCSVGYQIRLTKVVPRYAGSILYCTTGVVLKWLESDPELQSVSHLVLDEVHERDLQTDFLIICLRELLARRRDLKLILMSATLDAEMFSNYFGKCPTMDVPGRLFPVKEFLLEDVVEKLNYQPMHRNDKSQLQAMANLHGGGVEGTSLARKEISEKQRLKKEYWDKLRRDPSNKYSSRTIEAMENWTDGIDYELIHACVVDILRNNEPGAILIFLPGWAEINKCKTSLEQSRFLSANQIWIIPLHSMMPTSFQKEIFSPAPPGKTKIVISTNIAETSVTIEDVVYVIDAGMIKSTTYDPDASVSILAPELVSKANARQRAGRAGRVRPGICFHLFSSFAEESMTEYLKPEMLRTPLEEVCLQIKLLRRGMVFPFLDKAMNPPPQAVVARAVKNLTLMHALDEDEDITTLGYHLARMNVDPHTGKMILYGALFSCLDPILTIAASLGYRDPFVMPMGKEKEADEARYRLGEGLFSDHFMLYNAFTRWDNIPNPAAANDFAWGNFLAPQVLKMLKDMKRDFAGNLQSIGFLSSSDPKDFQANANSGNVDLIKAVVCAGLYPQVAYLHQRTFKGFRPKTGLIKNDGVSRSVAVHMKSVLNREKNFASPWLVYHQLLVTSKSYLFDATMVSHFPLLFFGGQIEKGVENDQQFIVIDDWIKFWADHSVANSVIELRVQLINILARKINNPRMVSWTDGERAILEAIIALVTTNTFGCFEEDYDEEVLDGYHEAYDPARY